MKHRFSSALCHVPNTCSRELRRGTTTWRRCSAATLSVAWTPPTWRSSSTATSGAQTSTWCESWTRCAARKPAPSLCLSWTSQERSAHMWTTPSHWTAALTPPTPPGWRCRHLNLYGDKMLCWLLYWQLYSITWQSGRERNLVVPQGLWTYSVSHSFLHLI